MAVSNGLGSQICNILVGLGMPWTLSTVFAGKDIVIAAHDLPTLRIACDFQVLFRVSRTVQLEHSLVWLSSLPSPPPSDCCADRA